MQQEQIKTIQDLFGWRFLARECSEYARCSLLEVMKLPAIEVAEIALLIHQKMELNKLTKSQSPDPYR